MTSLLTERRSTRHFSTEEVPLEEIERILDEASWAPSGGNDQPWKAVLLPPEDGAHLRADFEARGWDALFPKLWTLAERIAGTPLDVESASERVNALVKKDGFVSGQPWAVLVHYTPEHLSTPTVMRILRKWARDRWSPRRLFETVEMMRVVSPRVQHDSVVCFVHSLCLAATQRGLGSCIQYTYLNHASAITARLGIPSRDRLAALVWIGREREESRSAVGRGRRPVPTRVWSATDPA